MPLSSHALPGLWLTITEWLTRFAIYMILTQTVARIRLLPSVAILKTSILEEILGFFAR